MQRACGRQLGRLQRVLALFGCALCADTCQGVETSWKPAIAGRCDVAPLKYECTRVQSPRLVYPHTRPGKACKRLAKLGVKTIVFYGDSYMRHIYQATALVLSGNYADASMLKEKDGVPYNEYLQTAIEQKKQPAHFIYPDYGCDFDGQFLDANCRNSILREIEVCKDVPGAEPVTLILRFHDVPTSRPSPKDIEEFDVLVWGFGSHHAETEFGLVVGDETVPHSVNNATWLAKDILLPTCQCKKIGVGKLPRKSDRVKLETMTGYSWDEHGPNEGCIPWTTHLAESVATKVVWLQPHFRPSVGQHRNEKRPQLYEFSRDMPGLVRDICGVRHFLEPFNFTRDLVIESLKKEWSAAFPLHGEGGPRGSETEIGKNGTNPRYKYCDARCVGRVSTVPAHPLPTIEALTTPPYNGTYCLNYCFDMMRDGSHWGMGVNVIKAHHLITTIFDMKA